MSKRIMLSLVVIFAVIFLSGCSKGGDNEEKGNNLQNQEQKQTQTNSVVKVEEKDNEEKEAPPEGTGKGRMINPEESIAACVESNEGDSCSFTIFDEERGDMEVNGTCRTTPQFNPGENDSETETLDELACMPEMKSDGGRGNMPPGESAQE